jgi:hypothetical protein
MSDWQHVEAGNRVLVVDLDLFRKALMMPCRCEQPLPYTRPSGQVICLNSECGGRIEAKAEKVIRP